MSKKITIELTYEEYDKLMEIFNNKIKKMQPNAEFQEFLNNFFKMSLNSHYQIMNMTDNVFNTASNNIADIFEQFKNSFGSFENEPSITELMDLMQKMNANQNSKETKKTEQKKEEENKEQKDTIYKS